MPVEIQQQQEQQPDPQDEHMEGLAAAIAGAEEGGTPPVVEEEQQPAAEGEQQQPAPGADPAADDEREEREVMAMYNGRGRERVLKLHNEVKTLRPIKAELETLKKSQETLQEKANIADEWEDTLKSAGITEETFAQHLGAMRGQNSTDPNEIARAHAYYSKIAEDLGRKLGKGPAAALDADIQAEVDAGSLSAARAKEIQQLRKQGELGQRHTQQVQQQTQQERAVQQGVASMDALGEQMKATDPDFDRKMVYLKPTIQIIARTVPPAQWGAAFRNAYQQLPAMPAPVTPPPANGGGAPRPGHMPLRPTGGNGGMRPEPKSALEAMQLGIASAR